MALHVVFLPLAEERNEVVALESAVKHLWEEVQVGDEGSLQNDGDVASVEKLDGVSLLVATNATGSHSQFNTETLKLNKSD